MKKIIRKSNQDQKNLVDKEVKDREVAELVDPFEDSYICGGLEENIKNGTLSLFKGGCGKPVKITESYRCADCGAAFHRDCIRKHFKYHSGEATDKEGEIYILKNIIRNILWMSARYAHGRQTMAPSTVREAVKSLTNLYPDWKIKQDPVIAPPEKGHAGFREDYLDDIFNK